VRTCASCGRDNAVDARFCSACGAALLECAGRIDHAREALEQALALWERKRCLPVAGRARERINSLRQVQV
jgi:uncharacterized membrane protein YvbJ